MNNKFLVNVINPLNDLPDNPTNFRLLHSSIFPEHLKQLPPSAVLYKKIHIFFILKIPIQRGNISMCKIKLYAKLSGNLSFILFVSDLFFLHHFHAAQETSLFVLHEHYLPELPLAELFANYEILSLEDCGLLDVQLF